MIPKFHLVEKQIVTPSDSVTRRKWKLLTSVAHINTSMARTEIHSAPDPKPADPFSSVLLFSTSIRFYILAFFIITCENEDMD